MCFPSTHLLPQLTLVFHKVLGFSTTPLQCKCSKKLERAGISTESVVKWQGLFCKDWKYQLLCWDIQMHNGTHPPWQYWSSYVACSVAPGYLSDSSKQRGKYKNNYKKSYIVTYIVLINGLVSWQRRISREGVCDEIWLSSLHLKCRTLSIKSWFIGVSLESSLALCNPSRAIVPSAKR